MNPTKFGSLRKRVTLQRLPDAETFDSFGQPVQDWTDVGTYWAEVRPLSTREAQVARQLVAEASHKITIRYQGPSVVVDPTCRFQWGTRTFGIVEVLNVEERNRRYECIVKEIQKIGGV